MKKKFLGILLLLIPVAAICQNNKLVLKGHTGLVTGSCFSPDGKWIGSAGDDDNTAKIWDAKTGSEIKSFAFSDSPISCTFTPDGKLFITSSNNGVISMFETTKWKLEKEFTIPSGRQAWHVEVSPDGKTVAIACWDNNVYLLEIATLKLSKLEGHTNVVCWASYSPNGQYLVSASDDLTVILWDVKEMKQKQVYNGHSSATSVVRWTTDGTRLISGGDDHHVFVWETGLASGAVTGSMIKDIPVFDIVRAIACSPNGKYFAVGGATTDGNIYVFSTSTFEQVAVLKYHDSFVNDINFNATGTHLVSGSSDNDVVVWDLSAYGLK